ncbi:hypothetical protein DSL72_001786 [Monilinia vaccinii-corymbosi]|uniref:Peptidase A1 domain-containing protein n=1 Tax=Monilinia vaccinii-corymbosi TaxID=61207 RepID=A0A8A3PAV1_9HELO|nr:hypothetical protein DSL72_001786 [Monilinia vaccinii-corymbosi]
MFKILRKIEKELSPNDSLSINQSVTNDTFNIQYADRSQSQVRYITDNFLLSNATIHSLQMGLALNTSVSIGILGLSYAIGEASATIYPNIMASLFSQNLISTKAFSLYLDSVSSSTGSILFGAIDTTKFIGELAAIDIVPQPIWNGSITNSAFAIELVGMGITDQGGNIKNFTSSPAVVVLDSGAMITTLPANLTSSIFKYFNAYDDTGSTGNVYIPCLLLNTSSSLTINYLFSSSSVSTTIKIPLSELFFPLTNPIYALREGDNVPDLPFSGEACGFGIWTGSDGNYVLGDTFLRSAYVVYDLENNQIGLAQANFEDSNVSSSLNTGTGSIVELKAGETSIPALSGECLSSSATMSERLSTSTSLMEPKPTSSESQPSTEKATQTGKSDAATPISRSIEIRILCFMVLED